MLTSFKALTPASPPMQETYLRYPKQNITLRILHTSRWKVGSRGSLLVAVRLPGKPGLTPFPASFFSVPSQLSEDVVPMSPSLVLTYDLISSITHKMESVTSTPCQGPTLLTEK